MVYYVSHLIAKPRTSNTLSNISGESGLPCLISDFSGKTWNRSLFEYYVGCKVILNSFYYAEMCSLYIHFGKSFYHEWMLNVVSCFFWIYGDDRVAFVISFFHVVYQSDWFAYFEWSLWPWDESNLIAVYDPSYVLLGFICSCFVEFLHVHSSNYMICDFLFLVVSLSGFGIRVASQNDFESILSSSVC